jgi:aryl-alcohol dehydrogenase-like predicted oxidoreductase
MGERRKEIVLATKLGLPMDDSGRMQGGSRRYIMLAAEASLRRLRTDWIDLYQVHRPDPLTPIEETLRALDDLIRQGKIRYVGLSNHPAWRVAEAALVSKSAGFTPIVSCQDEFSLLQRGAEQELIPAMSRFGIGLLPYYPLAGGLLTGKYRRGEPPPAGARLASDSRSPRFLTEVNLERVEALRQFADSRGLSMLELAFGWLLAQDAVSSVIAGAKHPDQIAGNVHAATRWSPTPDEREELDRLTR